MLLVVVGVYVGAAEVGDVGSDRTTHIWSPENRHRMASLVAPLPEDWAILDDFLTG